MPRAGRRFAGLALAVAPALLGGGCAHVAAPFAAAGGSASPAAAAALAERLPVAAAGFRRGATRPAATGEGREAGYSTGAGRSTAAATVELLADGAQAGPALDAALAEAARAGPAREMVETGRFSLRADGAPPLLCAGTAGRYGRERVAGLLCAGRAGEGGTGGSGLLRIRVVMPAREPPPADPRAFAEAIAAALARAGAAG